MKEIDALLGWIKQNNPQLHHQLMKANMPHHELLEKINETFNQIVEEKNRQFFDKRKIHYEIREAIEECIEVIKEKSPSLFETIVQGTTEDHDVRYFFKKMFPNTDDVVEFLKKKENEE